MQFSNESITNPSATLSVARRTVTWVNSSTHWYFGWGFTTTFTDIIDWIQFSDESSFNPTITISVS